MSKAITIFCFTALILKRFGSATFKFLRIDLLTLVFQYDHVQFPGVVPRTFIGLPAFSSFPCSSLVSPFLQEPFWYLWLSPLSDWFRFQSFSSSTQVMQRHLLCKHDAVPSSRNLFFLVRIALGSYVVGSLSFFRRSLLLRKKSDSRLANIFAILCCSQFHLLFYASRTLPNT